ncbi:MAG: lecithin retinol acyltransferase family protein [Phycisphaerae bacterium]|nr:lecithin retinol acyltransferase family protein [Planctomycetota bacterium]MBL7221329.1 lecithin retinol acyltransferase family protein [Phycisphaerae bacterium]
MAKGDHIFVSKTGYSHHGIDIGNGKGVAGWGLYKIGKWITG